MTHIRVTWSRGTVSFGSMTTPEEFAAYVAEKAAASLEGPPRPELYPAPGPHEVCGFAYELVEEAC
jgi:hypothetical protein